MEARENIEEFIEHYNDERLNQVIDYVTPNQKHQGEAQAIIDEREKNHQEQIERRKRINQQRAESGKTKESAEQSV